MFSPQVAEKQFSRVDNASPSPLSQSTIKQWQETVITPCIWRGRGARGHLVSPVIQSSDTERHPILQLRCQTRCIYVEIKRQTQSTMTLTN